MDKIESIIRVKEYLKSDGGNSCDLRVTPLIIKRFYYDIYKRSKL